MITDKKNSIPEQKRERKHRLCPYMTNSKNTLHLG